MRQCGLWFLILMGAGATPALAQSWSTARWAMHGEMGVARATGRNGFAVGFGPSVRMGRATLSGWIDGLFTGGVSLDSLRLEDNQVRCGGGIARGDSTPCLGRSDMLVGAMLEATTPLEAQGPLRVGLGYRLGTGHGPAAVMVYDNTVLSKTSITVSARVGLRFFALRVGARLTP